MSERLPKVALDTARILVNPAALLVVQDLFAAGLNAHEVAQWLHTPNTDLDMHPPMELLIQGQGGQVRAMIQKTAEADLEANGELPELTPEIVAAEEMRSENVSGERGVPLNDDERFQ